MSTARSLCYMAPPALVSKCQPRKDCEKRPGGRLNKKDGLIRYGDSHVKDKTS